MPPQRDSASALGYSLAVAAVAVVVACATAVASFAAQGDGRAKSAQLFEEMATVFESPRCINCHTNTSFPTQGDDRHRHTMNIMRGPDGHGAPGLHCGTCHQAANQVASGVPGAPDWHLAPLRMGWTGLTPGQLCRALFDPAHGNMKPDRLVEHFNTGLVRWAWAPGTGSHGQPRTPPPMSHERFVELTRQWIASGATCPD